MHRLAPVIALCVIAVQALANAPAQNPAVDMEGFLAAAVAAADHRAARRLGESEFLARSRAPGTIVLDARSRDRFEELHVAGAVNLAYPDITVESLQRLIPDRDSTVLIYCNNNFTHAEGSFPSKLPAAALNLSTYIALYTYGYRNVYELAALVDARNTSLPLEGTAAAALRQRALRTLGGALNTAVFTP